jgi:RNA polymerase sigma-70 factor (ECF subfamily)
MGGEIEFEEVYREFHPKILHYISRMTGLHDAEDVTQEVFLKVSRSLSSFRGASKLSTWIYRIATNTALDKFKSPSIKRSQEGLESGKRVQEEDRDVWTGQKKAKPDQEIIRKEMSECVKEYVDRLPPDYRSVILLSELEGFKNREIADILQVSIETVKIRLHRAREKLKKLLDEGCDFYHNEEATLACDRKPPLIKLKKSD